jgi:hypothetical protein
MFESNLNRLLIYSAPFILINIPIFIVNNIVSHILTINNITPTSVFKIKDKYGTKHRVFTRI